MSLITVTSTETDSVLVSPSSTPTENLITLTTSLTTTLVVPHGQSLTLGPPQITPSTTVTVQYSPLIPSTITCIATELAVYLEDPNGSIWTTFTVEAQPTSQSGTSGWGCWSQAQKAGMIAGVVLFMLFATGLLCCLRCRKRYWVDSSSGPTTQATMGQAPGHPGRGWSR